uniref:Nucleolar MIF4G domain-containing protein 1 n=1 Tax=Lygus hesperus TaxID=30085 RepID=A0A0A9Z257_LYGHE
MRSSDYLHASIQLSKLKIPNIQQWHVMYIIILCATNEPTFNPYYGCLINQLCKPNPSKLYTFRKVLRDYIKKYQDSISKSEAKLITILGNLTAQVTIENLSTLRVLAFFNPDSPTKADILFVQTLLLKLFENINTTTVMESMLSDHVLKGTKDKVVYVLQFF